MSFFSDLFKGNFGNLGNDLNPSNVFKDFGSDSMKVLSNPLADVGIAAAVALPFLAPEILGGLGALGGTEAAVGAGTAADLGATVGGATDFATLGEGGVTAADFAQGGALTDAQIAALQASPGASAMASIAPTADTVNTLLPGAGAAPLSSTITGGATGNELLAGTGVAGNAAGDFTGASSGGGVLDSVSGALSGIGNFMGSPAGKGLSTLIGAGGLGINLLGGLGEKKALGALADQEKQQAQAAQQIQQTDLNAASPILHSGEALMQYLQTNTLPPQFQSQVDQWVQSTKAQIRQGYASRNPADAGAADPMKNTALAQDLANVDQQALGLKAQLEEVLANAGQQMVTTANSLLSSGLSATTLASSIPIQMAKLNAQLNSQMMSAISNFAAALNGGKAPFGGNSPQNLILPSGTISFGQ